MELTKEIQYVGVNDHQIDLFEGQYVVPKGMSYNSYVILDEKIAVMDTVDANFTHQWLANIAEHLGGRQPDYLVVQHMEPDHSANLLQFMNRYPQATLVVNPRTLVMVKNFFREADFGDRCLTVAEGDSLDLGKHQLHFVMAPMVHWPEVMVTYDATDKVLFSADGFGKFGALDADEPWAEEARRYYIGIVGKYGAQVQALLKKTALLEISMIAPLHGPVLKEDLGYYLHLYQLWSSYTPEEDGVVIAYTSVYGNTKQAVQLLEEQLRQLGCKVIVHDLARTDWALATADAFRYSKLVLASTTYNGELFPAMQHYLEHLRHRNFQKRSVALIENGSWAPMAVRAMEKALDSCKELTWIGSPVRILSTMNEENRQALAELAVRLRP